ARLRQTPQPRARRHGVAHHARHARHRGAGPARHRHRARPSAGRRDIRFPAGANRRRASGRGHGRRGAGDRGSDRAVLSSARRHRGLSVELARPYVAAFASRFLLMLQYRTAAFAGFLTQCWWGTIKVMVYAAFYATAPMAASMTFSQVVTYTWLAQGLLVLSP